MAARPALLLAAGCALAVAIGWWWRQRPLPVVVDMHLVAGAAREPSSRNTAELYLEERPGSRIRLLNQFNHAERAVSQPTIAEFRRQGVRLFLSTHPSTHAVRSLAEFSDGQALAINAAAASNALSGRDDFFFRVVADVEQEQRAIARALSRFAGRRLLVLQDSGNPAYTSTALAAFRAELQRLGGWQLEVRPLKVSGFDPRRERALMQDDFDALYILAGGFQPAVGHISQLFHQLHPGAPILLTPWSRSPEILGNTGPARDRTWLVSPVPARRHNPEVNRYFERFERRFGYTPNAMSINIRQAIEILDQALASGASSPAAVKRYLLSRPEHATSFGPVRFDASGDSQSRYHVFPARADLPP